MKFKFRISLLILILLFARSYIESSLVQVGVNYDSWSDLIFCGGMGCFLTLKYSLVLDVISFTIYFLIGREFLRLSKRNSIIVSLLFVGAFMLTGFYNMIGGQLFDFIPEFILPNLETNQALFWSIPSFIGSSFCVLILTLGIVLFKRFGKFNVT